MDTVQKINEEAVLESATVAQEEVKGNLELVKIKCEPNESTSANQPETPLFTFESVLVKCEPDAEENLPKYGESTSRIKNNKKTSKNKKSSKDKSTKKDAESKPKVPAPPTVCDPRYYDVEVNTSIEVVTISEEERQKEHAALWMEKINYNYKCENCAMGFVVGRAFEKHMVVHTKESGEFKCEICQSYVKTQHMLYMHKLRHYRRYKCMKCSDSLLYRDKESAACHLRTVHFNKAFRCEECNKNFKRKVYLKIHIEHKHTKPERLECPICQRLFFQKAFFRIHLRNHEKEVRASTRTDSTVFTCDTCAMQFKLKSYLRQHIMKQHTVQQHVDCDECGRTYRNRSVLKSHKRRDHRTDGKYDKQQCPICQKVISNYLLLRVHIKRRHTERDKNFICDYCQTSFYTKGELREHINWQHMRSSTIGVFCSCGLQFRNSSLLKAHEDRAHKGMPKNKDKACPTCGRAFSDSVVLRRHMRIHLGLTYPCEECGKTFKSPDYVRIHYKTKHLNMTRKEIKIVNKINRDTRRANAHASVTLASQLFPEQLGPMLETSLQCQSLAQIDMPGTMQDPNGSAEAMAAIERVDIKQEVEDDVEEN